MNFRARYYLLGVVLAFGVVSCSTGKDKGGWFSGRMFGGKLFSGSIFKGYSPLFESPSDKILTTDREIFERALELHQKGKTLSAIQLWKRFLDQNPKSFEALNNLGMSYYANDNLDSAVQSLESAMGLQPSEKKIRDNLIRTLRFRSTLAKENKEHPKAVADLQKIASLADPGGKEKILKEVEQEQDIIYKQVEQTHTIAAYEDFVRQYPSTIYAEKARTQIAKLMPEPSQGKEFESGPGPWPPPLGTPEKPKMDAGAIPPSIVKGNSIKETMNPETVSPSMSMPSPAKEMGTEFQAKERVVIRLKKMKADHGDKTTSSPASALVVEKAEKPAPTAMGKVASVPPKVSIGGKPRKVKITTRSTPLNVRKAPSARSPIIGRVNKGTTHSVLEESGGWFHIVYSKGKTTGWISKKYSQIVR
ncbi:MAG: SH3 domain-containing protein [Nitrospinota bacterium]|nr:SH3 domain-containing protein [Nitrospinota bacterium]